MGRVHYWQYIVDEEGRPLEDVNVRFYLQNNPTVEAEIFTHPSLGVSTTSSVANIQTDGEGFFEFWVADEFEGLSGYSATQKFKLTWERAGIGSGEIENIDVFPPIYTVDESDNTSVSKDDKNKLVSNELAYKWDNHVNSTTSGRPHKFDQVDITKQDTTYNKLVSNSLINYLLTAIASAGLLSIAASAAVERDFDITAWTASGDDFYTNINHFIDNEYPIVQIRNTDNGRLYMPKRIVAVDANTLRIFVTEENDSHVTVIG